MWKLEVVPRKRLRLSQEREAEVVPGERERLRLSRERGEAEVPERLGLSQERERG